MPLPFLPASLSELQTSLGSPFRVLWAREGTQPPCSDQTRCPRVTTFPSPISQRDVAPGSCGVQRVKPRGSSLRVRASSLKLRYLLFYFPFLSSEWEDCTFIPSRPLSLLCFVLSSSEPVKQKGHHRFLLGATGGAVPGRPCSRCARRSLVPLKWAMIYARPHC